MPGEISGRFRWTADDVTEALRWHLRERGPWRSSMAILLILALSSGIWALVESMRFERVSRLGVILGVTLAVYFLLAAGFVRWLRIWRVRRNFVKSTFADAEFEWHINDSGMRMKSVHSSSELAWTAFNRAVQTPEGLLLYTQPLMPHWLPSRAFQTEADFALVVEFVRSKITRFRVLSSPA